MTRAARPGELYPRPCRKCGTPKAADDFRPGKATCRACLRVQAAAYQARNAEEIRARKRDRYARDIETERERQNDYRARNREALRKREAERRARDPEKARAVNRKWYADNLEYGRAKSAKYRAENPEKMKALHAEHHRAQQAKTRPTAERHGYEWTSAELELVLDYRYTATELALILKRTHAAVTQRRCVLRQGDPRNMRLAGLDSVAAPEHMNIAPRREAT